MDYQNFYSDSLADTPMALCAEKAHLITNKAQTVNDWPKLDVLQSPEPIRAKIKLAIDELFGNICFYAYDSAPGPVTVCMENETDPSAVVISFIDKGIPYNPLEADEPDVELSGEDRPIGGLGIFLVQSTMDDLNYEYKDEQNILTFKKYLIED
jgi:anti-sigma regulatory factor (Ser/Thr protein kinase)